MSWLGKIIGGMFGFMLTGTPVGALLGAFAGHYFDRGISTNHNYNPFGYSAAEQHRIQEAFFTATFTVMGHVAKADGRVSEKEIRLAETVMSRMRLNKNQRQQAIGAFNRGKQADFNLLNTLDELMRVCHQQRNLLQMFVEIQIQAAKVDLPLSAAKKQILRTICERLGFERLYSYRFEQQRAYQDSAYTGRYRQTAAPVNELKNAYATLEIVETASMSEVKKAYRKQMSQNHPDKLIAKGLPEEMIKIATDKTQKIQKAYEKICEVRG